ncbi:SDR family NAD(P)-dependent oxidoreductase [Solwaraspora sp. WMMD792]|uniref:SDR family NAD(P)-dependent oxidoreductase n=1 Tax=Solwaraspora sp. WMMD792 TaxID=3016099 RepID=UPI002417AA85|nr:SDR family NAD(P)-dependent oxidoreductase [Solwaraspora sp. WMMD792]MDG4774030.1 SDR family NAD(P)-dependent oxidoreductase [Solwaraspora sp. WMMD792]
MSENKTTALVTGAGAGIGAAIAARLAGKGTNLVLVARDQERLDDTARQIRASYGVDVRTVSMDLSLPGAPGDLAGRLGEAGVAIDILVNNAGIALPGPVADTDPARIRTLVDLNAGAVAEITALFLPGMLTRRSGAIVNIASTAAYSPAPNNAAYAASKAFVLSFTQALWAETRGSGVRVVAVSPGATETPMNPGHFRGKRQPEQVADTVMAALAGRSAAVVDGWLYTTQTFLFQRVLPTRTTSRITGAYFAKAAERSRLRGT